MSTHYVIEVSIKSVTKPETPKAEYNKPLVVNNERQIEEVVKVISKAKTLDAAVEKTKGILDLELEGDE